MRFIIEDFSQEFLSYLERGYGGSFPKSGVRSHSKDYNISAPISGSFYFGKLHITSLTTLENYASWPECCPIASAPFCLSLHEPLPKLLASL